MVVAGSSRLTLPAFDLLLQSVWQRVCIDLEADGQRGFWRDARTDTAVLLTGNGFMQLKCVAPEGLAPECLSRHRTPAATGSPTMASILARSRPTLATATFRTPRLHRAGAWPVQGVLSRLITRTRISSDREGCRVGVAQLDCARLYSDDDFEPIQRQPSVQFALCGAARCASPVDTQVRLLSKLLRRQHYTLQTTQQSVTIETRQPIVGGRHEPISARRSECRSRKTLMPSFHRR